jgi:hypothetical protein
MLSFIPFPFGFFNLPALEKHIKSKIMQKHPRISKASQKGSCKFTFQLLPNNLPVASNAFSRYIGKASYTNSPGQGIRVYMLPCGCYIWCYSSGARELSALPF